ncbi:uncharacterized protein C18orf63-like [Uloborus diversus]|uniref:uncharacterized protein C18orf63-like n=1 Tax=Uloborus diversus TaxID=327109 RepID=UPI0024095B76|nr:uncharacterized protein C18orf63-like [Uloborus diversus]
MFCRRREAECLHYTVVSKLAPSWNKVNNLLLQGRDFLTSSVPLKAIDYGGWEVLNKFSFVRIDEQCNVLPSLKRAKILSLSKHIGQNSPFKSYGELLKHWKNMYGYRLPDLPESSICYVNVVFPYPSSPIYTYPIFCVRPFGVIEIPRINPQDTIQLFLKDFFKRVGSVCGEKCQLLDFKASFPALQLYAASDITEGDSFDLKSNREKTTKFVVYLLQSRSEGPGSPCSESVGVERICGS